MIRTKLIKALQPIEDQKITTSNKKLEDSELKLDLLVNKVSVIDSNEDRLLTIRQVEKLSASVTTGSAREYLQKHFLTTDNRVIFMLEQMRS